MLEVTCFKCISCQKEYPINEIIFSCSCGSQQLDVVHDWGLFSPLKQLKKYENSASGVWRFLPLVYPTISLKEVVTRGEGNTGLYQTTTKIKNYTSLKEVKFKHEGENPTGSFKDRGMTVGITEAKQKKSNTVICASTGNTSASLAAYASYAEMKSVVIIPEGEIAFGKLAQAIAYGSEVHQIKGNFDDALTTVQRLVNEKNYYLLNSINPWRIEGQKTIIFELLEQMNWEVPDWLVVPAGNLGNTSAFGKALKEAFELELITKYPQIVSVQAEGANPFVKYMNTGTFVPTSNPKTIATAIQIGNPVSYLKAKRALELTNGLTLSVTDQEILDAKAILDSSGIGCEPASASTLAGIKILAEQGTIMPSESVVAILTGHILKDPKIVIDYHNNNLESIKPSFVNQIQKW